MGAYLTGKYTLRQVDAYRFLIDCSEDPEILGEEQLYCSPELLPGGVSVQIYTNWDRKKIDDTPMLWRIEYVEFLDGRRFEYGNDNTFRNLVVNVLRAYSPDVIEIGYSYWHSFVKDPLIQSGRYIPYHTYDGIRGFKIYIYLDFLTVVSLDFSSLGPAEKMRVEEGINYTMPFYKSIPAKYYRKKLNEFEIMDACRRYMSNMGDYFLISEKEKHIKRNILKYENIKKEQRWKQYCMDHQ